MAVIDERAFFTDNPCLFLCVSRVPQVGLAGELQGRKFTNSPGAFIFQRDGDFDVVSGACPARGHLCAGPPTRQGQQVLARLSLFLYSGLFLPRAAPLVGSLPLL